MNELKVISLNGCPYSMAAEDLINNIKNSKNLKKTNINVINVPYELKTKYQLGQIKTFPQIYFNSKLIGGYDNLNNIYLDLKQLKNLDEMIKLINQKTHLKKRKEILRFIRFFIN